MDKRLYPISLEFFSSTILPIIEGSYIWKGRPPKISHYQVFCAILYVLRTGVSWRDLPDCFGNWHSVYTLRDALFTTIWVFSVWRFFLPE